MASNTDQPLPTDTTIDNPLWAALNEYQYSLARALEVAVSNDFAGDDLFSAYQCKMSEVSELRKVFGLA
jgi:hypothetical protein